MAQDVPQEAPVDARSRDEGFTLVEVVWALFLLGLIALGALGLFLNGMKHIAHTQRQQAAVSLANSAMDLSRSVSGGAVNGAGTSGLIKGRNQTDVTTTWNAAATANAADTADMTITWDPEPGMLTADQWVPVTTTAKVDNQTYTIDTLIGKCYRLKAAATTSQNCVAVNPAPTGNTYIEMYRVRVVVRWDESSTGSQKATYRLTSLVDPSADATWNTDSKPFAYDDELSVNAGAATFIAIVANDTVNYDTGGTVSPVNTYTQPGTGTVSVNTALGLNGVVFTAPSGSSGTVTFNYTVRDSAGNVSADPGIVTVHILPVPVTDTIYLATGSTTILNPSMLTNDRGQTNISGARKTSIVPVWNPTVDLFSTENVTSAMMTARTNDTANLAAAGITVDASGNVKFVAPGTETSTVFYYYLVDDPASGTGTRYPSDSYVKVTLTTETTPTGKDFALIYDATTVDTNKTIDWRTATSNPAAMKIKVTGITGPGASPASRVKIDGNPALGATGSALTFVTNTAIGNYEITYNVVSPSGNILSASQKITVSVVPVGVSNPVNVKSGTTGNIRMYTVNPDPTGTVSDFNPTTGVGLTAVTITGGQCGSLVPPTTAAPLAFTVTFTTSTGSPTCTLTFKVTSTTTGTGFTPPVVSQGTYTVVVAR